MKKGTFQLYGIQTAPEVSRALVSALSLVAGMAGCSNDEAPIPSSSNVSAPVVPDKDHVIVPGGLKMHKSCVHEVPSGSRVRRAPDCSVRVSTPAGGEISFPPCAHPSTKLRDESGAGIPPPAPVPNAWAEYSEATAPNNGGRQWFNGISHKWTVPSNPVNGVTVYLFNGLVDQLSPTDHGEILQPVLEWNGFTGQSVNQWMMASYWVAQGSGQQTPCPNQDACFSTPFSVSTGALVWGAVQRLNTQGGQGCNSAGVCDWRIYSIYEPPPGGGPTLSTNLTVTTTNAVFRRAYQGVLEAAVVNCTDFGGGSSIFQNGLLYQPPPTGDPNQMIEMYPSVSWSQTENSAFLPSCSSNFAVTNFTRGTTLDF